MWRLFAVVDGKYVWRRLHARMYGPAEPEFAWVPREAFWAVPA